LKYDATEMKVYMVSFSLEGPGADDTDFTPFGPTPANVPVVKKNKKGC
jgi:hypothetical protein